ncbi:MAG: hypothetical protein HYR88_09985 [Verrucomicrobia bacterium]|nr:hypothetical protein [Verrucomicrobiota bacterium]MBI3869026.1 hypothetical protein [Verrucomicrobiota bacterium]
MAMGSLMTTPSWRDKPEWVALIRRPGLAALGPGPRAGVWTPSEIQELVARHLPRRDVSDAIHALALLWNDRHDEAHSIVQNMEQDADGSLVHAILHRREPDYGNAAYWFRRVGEHPSFRRLAALAGPLLSRGLAEELLPGGRWSALGFCGACERVVRVSGKAEANAGLLPQIQSLETEAVFDDFWSRAGAAKPE